MVTMELGLGVLPQRPHQRHVLADDRAPPARRTPVVRQFRHVPPVSHAEREPAAGDEVERGDCLRQRDRVMLGDERYAGPDLEVGLRGDDRKRDVRVERPAVAFREVAAARVGRLGADRDVGVLRQQDRVEAALGGRAGEVGDRQGPVGREVTQGRKGTGRCSAHGASCDCRVRLLLPGQSLNRRTLPTLVLGSASIRCQSRGRAAAARLRSDHSARSPMAGGCSGSRGTT